jgi:ubiquinone/menaquinone biosynthesis C-methylase UbiE
MHRKHGRTTHLYDTIGRDYSSVRRTDPHINEKIGMALRGARRVVNVGAGTGNYEPAEGFVVAVEPSWAMIGQRPPGVLRTVRAVAERLPFPKGSFDLALATFTLRHWQDLECGLAELNRVSDGQPRSPGRRRANLTTRCGPFASEWGSS